MQNNQEKKTRKDSTQTNFISQFKNKSNQQQRQQLVVLPNDQDNQNLYRYILQNTSDLLNSETYATFSRYNGEQDLPETHCQALNKLQVIFSDKIDSIQSFSQTDEKCKKQNSLQQKSKLINQNSQKNQSFKSDIPNKQKLCKFKYSFSKFLHYQLESFFMKQKILTAQSFSKTTSGIANFNNVIVLKLRETHIEDIDLEQENNLRFLDLYHCQNLKNLQLKGCHELQVLNLGFTRLNGQQIYQICSSLPNLKKLYLNNCQQLYKLKLQNIKSLRVIKLPKCQHLQQIFLQNLQNLQYLDLTDLTSLKNVQIYSCQKIKRLNISIQIFSKLKLIYTLKNQQQTKIVKQQKEAKINSSENENQFELF